MRTVRSVAALGCGLIMLLTIGCGQGPKDQQIEAYQLEVNKLQKEKADLMNRLAKALGERDDALARLRDLEAQLAALQGAGNQKGRWTEYEGFAWTDIADNILFDSGKADLKATGRAELQTVLGEAKQRYPGWQVWIVGHTDTDPIKHSKWKDNLELSVERACTVFREMEKLGADPTQMVAAGQGQFSPKASNDTRANKQLNRRVQIIAIRVPPKTPAGGLETPGERG